MKDLLKHYTEKMDQLSSDYALLEMQDAVETYNNLRSMEYRTETENRALAEMNNKIIMWNVRVNSVIGIYKSLIAKDKDLIIPSPEKYFIKGFVE